MLHPTNPGTTLLQYLPIYDNCLREASPDTVVDGSTFIGIGHIPGTGSYRDVIWLDLSRYNSMDTITSAVLSLFWYYPAAARNQNTVVEICRPLDRNRSFVNWNSRTSSTPWSSPGGDWFDRSNASNGSVPFASMTFNAGTPADNKYYDFNVTELVKRYIGGTYNNTGFFLKARDENDNYIAFYSSESNANQRPKLVIESYDINGDGAVNVLDSYTIVSHLGEGYSGQQYPIYDVNSDGIVDTTDIDLGGEHFDR